MAYMYIRKVTAGFTPSSYKIFHSPEDNLWIDFDLSLVQESMGFIQAAFSHKSPCELASSQELVFRQILIRHPSTGEKLFLENSRPDLLISKTNDWWSGAYRLLAQMAIASTIHYDPSLPFVEMGKMKFPGEKNLVLQTSGGHISLENIDLAEPLLLCTLHESYTWGVMDDALLKEYPLSPNHPEHGAFIGYAPEFMPDISLEMWAEHLAFILLPQWERLTMFVTSLQNTVPSTEEVSSASANCTHGHESTGTKAQHTVDNEKDMLNDDHIGAHLQNEDTPKKYERVIYKDLEEFSRNVREAHKQTLPLLTGVLKKFSQYFSSGIEFEFRRGRVAVIISENKSRVRNLVNLVPLKDGELELRSEPLGLDLGIRSEEEITSDYWQLLIDYFNVHSEKKVHSLSKDSIIFHDLNTEERHPSVIRGILGTPVKGK